MFGPPGVAYVYRSYGIHWCLNFVCEEEGSASAVLIRALEPTEGLGSMRRRRGVSRRTAAVLGPRKIVRGAGRDASGTTVCRSTKRRLSCAPRDGNAGIVRGVRIGITKAMEKPWRYGLKGSRFLSKPFKA